MHPKDQEAYEEFLAWKNAQANQEVLAQALDPQARLTNQLTPPPPPNSNTVYPPKPVKNELPDELEIEIDGISFTVAPDIMDDWDIAETMFNARKDPSKVDAEQMLRFFQLFYGEHYERVKSELRKKNGGRLPITVMGEFLNATLEQVNAMSDVPKG